MDTSVQDNYCILDHQAVMKHMHWSGKDDDAGEYSEEYGRVINSAEFAFRQFIERYLEPILESFTPRQIYVCHDGGTDYRKRLFPEYKAKREADKKECEIYDREKAKLHEMFKNFYKLLGVTQAGVKGVEADDLIGYLCQKLPGMKHVYTVDADLLQLVNEETAVFLKLEPYTDDMEYKGNDLGEFNSIAVNKSLVGDTSDGYKGIHGVGPNAWEKLVEDYGFDGMKELELAVSNNDRQPLIDAIEATGDKVLQKVLDNFDEWRRQYNLAALHPELCWKPRNKKLVKIDWYKRVPDADKFRALMHHCKVEDLIPVFEPFLPVSYMVDATTATPDFIAAIKEEIDKSPFVSWDYESDDPNKFENFAEANKGRIYVDMLSQDIVSMSMAFGANLESSIYVTVDHLDSDNVPLEVLKDLLVYADSKKLLVAQNAMFEITVTANKLGVVLDGMHDTMIMHCYTNEDGEHGLKRMSKNLLNYDQASYEETLDGASGMSQITAQQAFGYGIDDSVVTAHLYDLLKVQLHLEDMWDFYQENEVYPVNVLSHAYLEGTEVDWDELDDIHKEDMQTIESGMARVRELLESHCVEQGDVVLDHSGAEAYIEAERNFFVKSTKAKLRQKVEDGKADLGQLSDKEWVARELTKARTSWEAKLLGAVSYKPYSVEYVAPEFKPTVKQFNNLLEKLNIPVPIESVAKGRLTEWIAQVKGLDCTDIEAEPTNLTDEQSRFCRLLGEAAPQLSKRTGEQYDALIGFCEGYFAEDGKEVTDGDELSFGSPKQMQELYYCKLGLPIRLRGKTAKDSARRLAGAEGSPSTDDKAVKMALANDCEPGTWKAEVLDTLVKVKAAATRCGLYHVPYPLWKHPLDNKLHPGIRNCGTATRRPSGSNPNVLQVSKFGRMRGIVVPPKNYVVVAIDYAGQEIRILACQSNDPTMKSIYLPVKVVNGGTEPLTGDELAAWKEKDLHSMTASGIAKMSYEDYIAALEAGDEGCAKIRSKKAKGTNFGLAYGITPPGLSRNITVPESEAKALLDDAFNLYDRVLPWQEESGNFGRRNGYTLTAYGNRRHMSEDIFDKDRGVRSRMERQGANAEIQGTAADMLKIVLTRMWKERLIQNLRMVFFAPVYDEVVSFVHKDDVLEYWHSMRQIMSEATPPTHEVPQVPELSIGRTWRSPEELGRAPTDEEILAAVDRSINPEVSNEEKAA